MNLDFGEEKFTLKIYSKIYIKIKIVERVLLLSTIHHVRCSSFAIEKCIVLWAGKQTKTYGTQTTSAISIPNTIDYDRYPKQHVCRGWCLNHIEVCQCFGDADVLYTLLDRTFSTNQKANSTKFTFSY